MKLRLILSTALVAMVAGGVCYSAADAKEIKIGIVGPKTGPLAGGATITHFPTFKLWAHKVNARGGLKLKGGKRKIKLIEYDDRTQPGETIKAVQRLATVDKVDWIMAPYGTGFNVATAPIFNKLGYPQLAVAAVTDQVDKLVKRYSRMFFLLGTTTQYATSAIQVLKSLKDAGKINNRVAVVNVADTFGIELAHVARPLFKKAGFNIVYDKSYPLGTQDLAPVIKAAKAAKPDAFVAWSYPPDTFGLAEQAKIEQLKVKAYYSAVATAFPVFKKKFGKAAENILGMGGVQDTPAIRKFFEEYKQVTKMDADHWGNVNYWAHIEVVEQAIEAVGSMDRDAITKHIKNNTFKTILGKVDLRNQKMNILYSVGQWEGDLFHAVKGYGVNVDRKVKLKSGW